MRRWLVPLLALVAVVVAATLASVAPATSDASKVRKPAPRHSSQAADPVDQSGKERAKAERPNIVFVLMDDFSMDLLQTMRSAKRMRAHGASYPHAFVVDSLCCVSRSSTFTGQYPHQTGVRTNMADPAHPQAPQGGFGAFRGYGNERRSFAVSLQRAGYTTGYVGKYLNQYEYQAGGAVPPAQPGWDDQRVVFGSAYDGWDFHSTRLEGGAVRLVHHPAPPATATAAEKDAAYAGTVIAEQALDFLRTHRDDAEPFFLEVAPYAPHSRVGPTGHYPGDPVFPAAFRDRPSAANPGGNCGAVACGALTTRDLPGYADRQGDNRPRRKDGTKGPAWNPPPSGMGAAKAVTYLRDRARMAQSVDRMVARILDTVDDNTIVVLTSDNGFHLGQQGLAAGKGSPYTTDVRVPLLVVGPGVVPGKRNEIVTNLDWAATFEALAGAKSPAYRSGESFAETLTNPGVQKRDYVYFEHTWSAVQANADPDRADPDLLGRAPEMDKIPSYVGVRSRTQLLVRFDLDPSPRKDYVYEFYNLAKLGYEKTNRFGKARFAADVKVLMGKLAQFDRCAATSRNQPVSATCRTLSKAATTR